MIKSLQVDYFYWNLATQQHFLVVLKVVDHALCLTQLCRCVRNKIPPALVSSPFAPTPSQCTCLSCCAALEIRAIGAIKRKPYQHLPLLCGVTVDESLKHTLKMKSLYQITFQVQSHSNIFQFFTLRIILSIKLKSKEHSLSMKN